MDYSKEINSLLGDSKSSVIPTIEDPKTVLKVTLDFLLGFCIFAAYLIF